MERNEKAFLDVVAWSELGAGLLAVSDNGYNVLVGATPHNPLLFSDYSRHPHIYNKDLNSTAAGRYQFIYKTWVDLQTRLNLPDFGPESQDKGGIQLLKESRALDNIHAGNFRIAIAQCSHIWASLPGANYGQHENDIGKLQEYFVSVGGTLAKL